MSTKPALQSILEAVLQTEEKRKHTQDCRKERNEVIVTETQIRLRPQI